MWVLIVLSTWNSAVPVVMHDFSSKDRCEEAGKQIVALGTYIYEEKGLFSKAARERIVHKYTCTEK